MGQLKSNFQYNMKLLAVFVALVMAVDTVMVVMDMVDTVASVPPMLMLTMVMDMDVVMLMVDTDTHTLMEVTTISARDLLNHQPTTVMDTDAVTDMADTVERDPLSHTTDMVDTEDMEVTDMVVTDM